jgi:NitT/TauT family transport system permease protein
VTDQAILPGPGGSLSLSALAGISRRRRGLLLAGLAWGAAGAVTLFWPNLPEVPAPHTSDLGAAQVLFGALLVAGWLLDDRLRGAGGRLRARAPWLIALAVLATIWQVATAKTSFWPQPFFPAPQGVIDAYATDWPRLLQSVGASLVLLGSGVAIGAGLGFVTGLFSAWSRRVGYWTGPALRLIGPIPASALLPLAMFFFPTPFAGSVFLVALATWFPVTILTLSGVAAVDSAYYDVARTLGGGQRFQLLKVAIPASLPHVFVGLFMGLGAAIAVLISAEMVGVKAGLGYYLSWAQGWAAYGHLFAGLFVMAGLFSLLTTLLFRGRDRALAWQKGAVKW